MIKISSITNFELLKFIDGFSLVIASPVTGRKHQIRNHFNSIGHPIVGDDKWRQK